MYSLTEQTFWPAQHRTRDEAQATVVSEHLALLGRKVNLGRQTALTGPPGGRQLPGPSQA